MRKERHPSVAHKSSLLMPLTRYVNEKDSQDLAVGLKRGTVHLTSVSVCLLMLGGDQASDRRRTGEVRGSLGLLDPVSGAQPYPGRRN